MPTKMVERIEDDPKSPELFQNRFEWYRVNKFLQNLSQVAKELELRSEDLIHLGGTALFYRCYQAFGPSATVNFRGTRDMDVMSFRQGVVQQVMDRIVSLPSSGVDGYEISTSHSLPNKKSMTLNFKAAEGLGVAREFEVDLYESAFDNIRFNDRVLREGRIILDPPELLSLSPHRGMVSVPSIRDGFVIKMDILDYSKKGLRPKDQLDILTTYKICATLGMETAQLLLALIGTSTQESALKKLDTLKELLIGGIQTLGVATSYSFLPDSKELDQAIKDVCRFRDYEIYKH